MAPQRGRNNLAQQCVAVTALLACAFVLKSGTAFTSAPQVPHGAEVKTGVLRAAPAARAVVSQPLAGSSATPWVSIGSVGLLWAAAAAAVRAVQGRSAPKSAVKVVACQATRSFSAAPAPVAVAEVAPAPTPIAATHVPSLIDAPAPATVVVAAEPAFVAPAVPEVFSIADEVPVVVQEEKEAPTFAASASTTRRPARFIGGARLPQAKSTGRAASSRAARRAVGAKLMPAVENHVVAPSFDASRCRMHIQLGLRTTSRVHSECNRELNTPCSSDVSSAAKILNVTTFLVKHYLKIMENSKLSID